MSPVKLSEKELFDSFTFFNEVGIIYQLSRTLFERVLPSDLQIMHFTVLNNLARFGDGKLPSDLAKAFQTPRSNMTQILRVLEEKNFIKLTENVRDGRSKLIYITKKGLDFRKKAIQAFGEPTLKIAASFDLEKLGQMKPILAELRAVLDATRDELADIDLVNKNRQKRKS